MEIDETHPRTILHFDIDYYYAQVEELLDPSLKTKAFGIQQNYHVVTCNYLARAKGVSKWMLLTDALKKCPDLVLVNGEDTTKYKEFSAKIFEVMHKFTSCVERLGMDENWLDVTDIIAKRMKELGPNDQPVVEGCTFPEDGVGFDSCDCGCARRMILGTHLAKEIRTALFEELGITSCGGVSYNKLLAKIVGSMNKPNQQTVLVPSCTVTFMASLCDLRKITGIGTKTAELLEEINIKTIEELQDCELDVLKKKFGYETAVKLKDMSFGRDFSLVRPSGKPKSIGLEDSCKPISIKGDVEEKFRMLLTRLVKQISEDGRIPVTVKVTVRKVDAKKQSHRETKQCNVLASLFRTMNGRVFLADGANEKLLKIVMRLFERSVDLKQPFNITLLGLAFTKFQERQSGPKSIANFLIKKSDVEVQSITNLCNVAAPAEPNLETARFKNSSSPLSMDYDTRSETSLASLSGSESEIEPSPKKTRFGLLIAKRRCLSNASLGSMEDISSPSKLKVADLRLNSKEFDREWSSPKSNGNCGTASTSNASIAPSTPTTSHHHKLFQQLAKKNIAVASQLQQSTPTTRQRTTVIPTDVDPNVFKELPLDMQKELLTTWRAASSGVAATATIVKQNLTKSTINGNKSAAAGKKKGTLHRYFIRSDVNTQ